VKQNEEIEKLNENPTDTASMPSPTESAPEPIVNSVAESDAPKTASDIAKEKQQYNSGNMDVIGNRADNQQFIQTAVFYGGNNFNIREVVGNDLSNTDIDAQEYDLSKADEYAAFGEKYGASEYFAFSVILSVFDYAELDDLHNLKSKLLEELPPIMDDEGKVKAAQQNPYISINSILRIIKGRLFTTGNGENCVGLGDNRHAALSNLWMQFSTLRGNIARWLLAISDSFEYRTNFDAFQVSSAFINVMKLDFTAGARHLFPRLYSNPEKYWLLGHIALALYNDKDYRSKILPFITDWTVSESNWLWKAALYVYAHIVTGDEDDDFVDKTRRAMELRFTALDTFDRWYIGFIMIISSRLRMLIADILNALITKARVYDERVLLALTYINFLRYGYYSVSESLPRCPLFACDTKSQLMRVQPLITAILPMYSTRRMFFSVIEAYLKEISAYSVDEKTVKHIKAYFSLMAENNSRYIEDILIMLRKCDCTIANAIIPIVEEKMQKYIEVR